MTESSDAYPSLTVLGGEQAGACFVLDEAVDNVLIGSDPSCRFHLPIPGVSPVHARIWIDDTGITVYDTSSPDGVYVNDDRVVGQTRLRNGDVIWLGAPGGPQSVLIQCRIPPRDAQADETVAMAAEPVEAEPVIDAEPAPEGSTLSRTPPAPSSEPPVAATHGQEFEEDLGETVAVPAPPAPPAPPAVHHTPTPARQAPPPPPRAASGPQPPAPPAPPVARPAPRPPAPQAPVAHAPASPARPARVAPHAATPRGPAPRPRGGGGGKGGVWLGLGLVVLVALGVGAFFAYQKLVQKPQRVATQPTPAPQLTTPTPAPVAAVPVPMQEATPSVEEGAPTPEAMATPVEEVIPVGGTPTPRPTPTPKPTPTPAKTTPTPVPRPTEAPAPSLPRSAELVAQATQAFSARKFDVAAGLYDQVLAQDPGNAQAQAGKRQAAAAIASAAKQFVAGRTSVRSASGGGKADLSGFETSDVKVAKAPDYSGLIEFKVSPPRVVPGDAFSVQVTLTNDGKKPYRVQSVMLTTKVNGEASPARPASSPVEVRPKATSAIAATTGTWAEGTRNWSLEVVVTTDHGDVFSSRLYWR